MTKFDYPYTCPDINRAIKTTKRMLTDSIENFIDEHMPESDLKNEMAEKYVKDIHPEIVNILEGVRETNQDMRKSVELQISELDEIIKSMKEEISDLEDQIKELNRDIELLNG